MKKIFNTLLLFVCLSCLPAFGQVTFSALDAEICDLNGTATVDFTINTTDTLGAFQFAIVWDTDILENAVLEDLALGSSYNEDSIAVGEIRVGWFNAAGNGDFDPNEVLFRITFDHVNGSANSASVDFVALPDYAILVADDNFGSIPESELTINDATITYGDAISPLINNCPTNISQTVPYGQLTDVVTWADIMPTDNCTTPVLTESHSSGDTFPIGTTEVSITAADAAGNVSLACEFTVTISEEVDDTPFTINISEEETGCANVNVSFDFTTANFTEMTGIAYGITWDPNLLEYANASNIFSPANDFNENEAANGELRVGWFDGSGANLDDGALLFTLNFNFIGNIGDVASIQMVDLPSYPIIIADENGELNPSQYELNSNTVTHADNAPPIIPDCPLAMAVENDMGVCDAVVNFTLPTIIEDCYANISLTQTSLLGTGDTFPIGESTVSYEATDNIGQTATCSFTVTVSDTEAPSLSNCPEHMQVSAAAGSCESVVNWTEPTAIDNCEAQGATSLVGSHTPGSTFSVGQTYNITYTATDAVGNDTLCFFFLKVVDDESPVITACLDNISQTADADACGTVVTWQVPTATDNCGTVDLTSSHNPDTTFPIGLTNVTYTATDASNNETLCSFSVTVIDDSDPMISCPDNITMSANSGCSQVVTWQAPTPIDNCTISTFTASHNSGEEFPSGETEVIYTAVDAAENEVSCSFTITIDATNNITMGACPPNQTVIANSGQCTIAAVMWTPPTATNTCNGEPTLSSNYNPGDDFPVGSTVVTYEAVNAEGNMASCSFNVTVNGDDTESPVVICPADIEITLALGETETAVSWETASATDNCTADLVPITNSVSGSTYSIGIHTVDYMVSDDAGNEGYCAFDIEIQATTLAPTITTNFTGGICEGGDAELCATTIENATYVWFDTNGVNVGNTQCLLLDDVEMSNAGTYSVFIQSPGNSVLNTSYDLVVFEAPELSVNVAPILCATGTENLEFFASDLANTNVTEWSWTGVNDLSQNIQNLFVVNVDESDAGTYSLTATNDNNCVSQISVEAIVSSAPPAAELVASNQVICAGESTVLIGTNYGTDNVTYNWTAQPVEGAGLPANTNSFQIEVTPTLGANVTYSMSAVVEGCSVEEASILIVQEGPPTINIAATGNTICVDGTSSLILSETGGQATDWNWTGPNGFTAQGQEIIIDNLTAADAGFYSVTASTNLGCANTMTYQVEVTEKPVGLTAEFLDAELCEGENALLNIAGFTGNGVSYEFTGINAPAATNQTNVNFGSFDFGVYEYSMVAVSDGCTSEPIDIGFEVQSAPNAAIVDTGQQECVEAGSQISLAATIPFANYEWTFNGEIIGTNSSIVLEDIGTEDSGLYQLAISGSFGCTSTVTEVLSITEAVEPVEIALSNGACVGEVLQLQAIDENADLSYRWTLNGELFSTEQNPTIDFLSEENAGTYSVSAINPQTGCTSTSPTETLSLLSEPILEQDFGLIFLPTPNIEMTLTDNDNIPEGADYTISIFQDPEFGRIEIIDATKGKINYIRETETARTDRFFYEVCYDDCDNACARAMVTINIKYSTDDCVTTNLISPNGDGTNDEFIIYCLEDGDFADNVLTIYNQWGDKVYSAAPYQNDWKGTFEGEDLPDGTYFYTFRRDAQSEVKKGHLTIFR